MSKGRRHVTVLTWNIHGCVGRDGAFDPKRILGLLREAQPDLVALQEIDARTPLAAGLDPFVYFAEGLGWISASVKTLETPHGHYGHMLLSRWPMDGVLDADLSMPGREPRKAIVATVRSPWSTIFIIAVHLGLNRRERRFQIARLKGQIDARAQKPMVVVGDFNEIRRRGAAERTFCPPLQPTDALPTYPSRCPVLPLDRIWHNEPLRLVSMRTLKEGGVMSDHLPLIVDLSLTEA
jgi:endonuclease/exonuclease/phosphatase family metal-dependent hydrolase